MVVSPGSIHPPSVSLTAICSSLEQASISTRPRPDRRYRADLSPKACPAYTTLVPGTTRRPCQRRLARRSARSQFHRLGKQTSREFLSRPIIFEGNTSICVRQQAACFAACQVAWVWQGIARVCVVVGGSSDHRVAGRDHVQQTRHMATRTQPALVLRGGAITTVQNQIHPLCSIVLAPVARPCR